MIYIYYLARCGSLKKDLINHSSADLVGIVNSLLDVYIYWKSKLRSCQFNFSKIIAINGKMPLTHPKEAVNDGKKRAKGNYNIYKCIHLSTTADFLDISVANFIMYTMKGKYNLYLIYY